jgi:type VI secretion system secreted protein VgrG
MAKETFHIKSDSPVNADLLFWQIAGHESLSRPSIYQLGVLSTNAAIEAKEILGIAFDVVIDFLDAKGKKQERHFHGHAVRFVRLGKIGRYFYYQFTLESWFGLLTRRMNSRIIQEKPLLETIKAVLQDSPIKKLSENLEHSNVSGVDVPLRYCVQHQETDYHFISRLLETAGVYYWFDVHHDKPTMFLSNDSQAAHTPLPVDGVLKFPAQGQSETRFNEISRWVSVKNFGTGKHGSADSNFKTIDKKLATIVDLAEEYELADFESFEFPGGYFNTDAAQDISKVRGYEIMSKRERHYGLTSWPDAAAGSVFELEGHSDKAQNRKYVIGSCTLLVTHPGYADAMTDAVSSSVGDALCEFIKDDSFNSDGTVSLANFIKESFGGKNLVRGTNLFFVSALTADTPFKPSRLTPKVIVPGPQSAIVVGPKGQDYHVDKLGRVKVHFHWDKYGDRDENSTCWVRVSQPMAGQGWGGYFMPRIGQEVIVDFLNGDPDRPVIVGRVYNGHQSIPYSSPSQSGFKTRSTPKGGPNDYNEIMFEDKKNEEVLSLHAQRNLSFSAEADQSTTVGHDQSANIKNDRSVSVGNNESNLVQLDQNNYVGGTQASITVGAQTNFLLATQFTKITGKQVLYADAGQEITAKGIKYKVNGFRKAEIVNNDDLEIAGYQTTKVGKDYAVLADGNIKLKTLGKRTDAATGDHFVMTDAKLKLLASTGIQIMTPASIDCTSMGSNTTIMGQNSSGYLGENREANMGMAVSNFIGLSLENALGLATSNFAGLGIENYLGAKTSFCVAAMVECVPIEAHQNALFSVTPGAPAANAPEAGAGLSMLALLGNLMIGVAGIGSLDGDSRATMKQYREAKAQLEAAADAARAEGLTTLASRLDALAEAAKQREEDPLFSSGAARSERAKIDAQTAKLEQAEQNSAQPLLTDSQNEALVVDPGANIVDTPSQNSNELPSASDADELVKSAEKATDQAKNEAAIAKEKQVEAANELTAKQSEAKEAIEAAKENANEQLTNAQKKTEQAAKANAQEKLNEVEKAKESFDKASDAAQNAAENATKKAAEEAKANVISKAADAFPKEPTLPSPPNLPKF